MQYFDKASALKLALEQGDVDVAYRSLSPTDIEDLRDADGVEVVEGNGTEIRYLGFNLDIQAGRQRRAEAGDPPGRRADDRPPVDRRQRLQRHRRAALLDGPGGRRLSHRRVRRGLRRGPDVDAAKQTLDDAGVETPVPLEIWWTPTPLRARLGRRVRRDQAPARRQRPVRRDAEVDRVEPVLRGRRRPTSTRSTSSAGSRTTRTPTTTRRPSTSPATTSTTTTPTRRWTSCSRRRRRRPTTPVRSRPSTRSRRSAPRTPRRFRSGRASRWPGCATASTGSRRRSTPRSSSASGCSARRRLTG